MFEECVLFEILIVVNVFSYCIVSMMQLCDGIVVIGSDFVMQVCVVLFLWVGGLVGLVVMWFDVIFVGVKIVYVVYQVEVLSFLIEVEKLVMLEDYVLVQVFVKLLK